MTFASSGKSGMVWQLRAWMGGDPAAQVGHAQALGLASVCIKINDGRQERWENRIRFPDNQNADLLPATVDALQAAGIKATAWGWTYGGRYVRQGIDGNGWIFRKDATVARQEGELAGNLCLRYGMEDYWIDAEHQYNQSGMEPSAVSLCEGLRAIAPDVNQFLCSYRFPRTAQPAFPMETFAPHMNGWAPQVYFLGDNRVDGGAIQLQRSKENHYDLIRRLPYIGVAPTYVAAGPWTATKLQLTNFFQKAVDIGCEGISIWAIEKANPSQLEAIGEFDWPGVEPPEPPEPPGEKIGIEVRVPAGKVDVTVTET
jgi:hypothetical protein